MFSYTFFFLSSILLTYPSKKYIDQFSSYGIIFFSIVLAYYLTGLTALLLTLSNLSKFPIIIISIVTFLSLLKFNRKNNFSKIKGFLNFLINEIKFEFIKKNANKKEKTLFIISSTFLLLIFFSSIGPINHPDATDYHVGYPYQYFLYGKFFIDGGLHQGLLGIGDYANLAFIQEKSLWLIRPLQILSLPPLIIFLGKNIKNKYLIFLIISCPVLIQWSTIGKPLFLHESCLAVLFYIWENKKTYSNTKFLLISIIFSIGIKVSTLIIISPIIFYMIYYLITTNKFAIYFSKIISDKLFLFSLFSLILIIYSRFMITDNFFYPLLTNIFNKDNEQINNFAIFLKSYGRSNFFPLNIFIPLNIKSITLSLGFPIAFCTLLFLLKNNKNIIIKIGFIQFLLLLIFCQGRGDYYFSPIFLLISQSNSLFGYLRNKNIDNFFKLTIITQTSLFLSFLIISISQNIRATIDYQSIITKSSYGYNLSKLMSKDKNFNTLFLNRNTRFFYDKNYIDKNLFENCLIKNKLKKTNIRNEYCLNKYKIKRVISTKETSISKLNNYICKYEYSNSGSRNPINRKKIRIEICDKK